MTGAPPVGRVLVVTNMWPTQAAPMAGIFVAEQVASLRRRGLDLDVVFVDGIAGGWPAYLRGFGQVRAALRRKPYDLVHAHYVFSGILAIGGRLLAGRRTPIVLTQHGIETQVGWTAPLCRWTSRLVDATVATSRCVRDALRRPDATVIPCGVDMDLFRPLDQTAARRELGFQPDEPLVLFAGMRRPEKRLDLVEAAVAQVQREAASVRLVVAEDVPHERMPLYMNAADVLILASEAEGSPMVIKEAMACNLPIVSVDVGDVAELIGGVPGCYVVQRSASALAEGLARALSRRTRTTGRAAIESLSLDAIAVQLMRLYQDVHERTGTRFSSKVQTNSRGSI